MVIKKKEKEKDFPFEKKKSLPHHQSFFEIPSLFQFCLLYNRNQDNTRKKTQTQNHTIIYMGGWVCAWRNIVCTVFCFVVGYIYLYMYSKF